MEIFGRLVDLKAKSSYTKEKIQNYNLSSKKERKTLMGVAFMPFHGQAPVEASCLVLETKAAKYGMSKPKSPPQPSTLEQLSRTNKLAACGVAISFFQVGKSLIFK